MLSHHSSHAIQFGGQRLAKAALMCSLEPRTLLAAYAVQDINEGPSRSEITTLMVLGDQLYFHAYNDYYGTALWRSDGTTGGTRVVKDLHPGDSSPTPERNLGALGDLLFFEASVGPEGAELWKSDGTDAGTQLVKDIYPEGNGSLPGWSSGFAFNDRLYFAADDGTHGIELWATTGTEQGTALVKDINPAGSSNPIGFTVMGNVMYFAAVDAGGNELWRSDGTEAGTYRVADISTGPDGSAPFNFHAVGDTLYFAATDPIHGRELWKSEGTSNTTTLVKDIRPGEKSSDPFGTFAGAVVGNAVLFTANDGANGSELWMSDGSLAGTTMLLDINPGGPGSVPRGLFSHGGKAIFSANDWIYGRELWISDGTPAGTHVLKDIFPGVGSSLGQDFAYFAEFRGQVYFGADDNEHGIELWTTDLTASGTRLVADISPNAFPYSQPSMFTATDDLLFFTADHPSMSRELWAYAVPIAVAGGPYVVQEGDALVLNGGGSHDPTNLPITVNWDINGDGDFSDASGISPTVSWSQLKSLGLSDGPLSIGNVRVRVTNSIGEYSDSAATTVQVDNRPPILSISGPPSVPDNAVYTLNLAASDPGDDLVTSWNINWGDGSETTIPGNPPSVSHSYVTEGNLQISASATDEDGTYVSNSLALAVGSPPQVVKSEFYFEEAPHALRFGFSEDVSASVDATDLTLLNTTSGFAVPATSMNIVYISATNTAEFTFPGVVGGVLVDGSYTATLTAAGVADVSGKPLAADHVFQFHVFGGDANRDRVVDITDLGILATNWQGTNRTYSQGDFNYDDIVDITDLGILASNWQDILPAHRSVAIAPRALGVAVAPPRWRFSRSPLPALSVQQSLVDDLELARVAVV